MEIFINENSLHGQYAQHNVLEKLRNFLTIIKVVNQLMEPPKLLSSSKMFEFQAIEGSHLNTTFRAHKDLWDALTNNLKNTVQWQHEQTHSENSDYEHSQVNYVTRSIAEFAERKIQSGVTQRHLLNFPNSIFATSTSLEVIKDKAETTTLSCSNDEEELIEWLISVGLIDPNKEYDVKAKHPPMDYQTVLSDKSVFAVTGRRNQGRRIYKRIGTTELWVVDNQHYGKAAHIEIFRETTDVHLGISEINKIEVNAKYKVVGRTIR